VSAELTDVQGGGMRCRHLNSTISREAVIWLDWWFKDGVFEGDYANEAQPTGKIRVMCDDCGLDRYYREGRLPRWLKKRNDELPIGRSA
jgi:hypothetical protein